MSIIEELRRTVFGEGSDFLDKLVACESRAEFVFLELLADDVTRVSQTIVWLSPSGSTI